MPATDGPTAGWAAPRPTGLGGTSPDAGVVPSDAGADAPPSGAGAGTAPLVGAGVDVDVNDDDDDDDDELAGEPVGVPPSSDALAMLVPVSAAVTKAPPTIAEAGIHLRRGLVAAAAVPLRSAGSPTGVGVVGSSCWWRMAGSLIEWAIEAVCPDLLADDADRG